MDRETTRRALLGSVLGAGVAGGFAPQVRPLLDLLAPYSGRAWSAFDRDVSGTVESPYGPATLRYDDHHVAHVDAADDRALFYAIGFAQANDRLFQMDVQRRQVRGELSAVFGDTTVDSDVFYTKMDVAGAAETTWAESVAGSDVAPLLEAYADGVNRYVEDEPLPLEFRLVDYEPDPWTPTDTLLAEKQISWGLTGSFETLRLVTLADELGEDLARTLLPQRLDHDYPILRDGSDATVSDQAAETIAADPDGDGLGAGSDSDSVGAGSDPDAVAASLDPDLVERLSTFESPRGIGSNSWVVSDDHTESGQPIVANDPHLLLQAPPIWYEQHLEGDDLSVRGVTFPGVPMVIIGENDAGAWGFTNAGVDCIDFYRYDTRDDGREYRYGDEWREFDRETTTVSVADGEDREVAVEKSVHGAVLGTEPDGDEFDGKLGVAWTGLTATRTSQAVDALNRSDGLDDALDAMERFDEPTQNFVYADRDGRTCYYTVGKIPERRTDGEVVSGRQVFDGSAKEGEWAGYTPFGASTWEGFVPFDEQPHSIDPGYVGTANQRIVDDPGRYLAESYSPPFRGKRIYDRLDARVAGDDPVTPDFMADLQADVFDERAARLVPDLLDAAPDDADLRGLADWDYRMRPGSVPALLFARTLTHFRENAVRDVLEDGLGDRRDVEEYYPNDHVLLGLRGDPWFPDGRDAALRDALETAIQELDDDEWADYGDLNRLSMPHPFDQSFLNYPQKRAGGSIATVDNYRRPDVGESGSAGSSWRMVSPMAGDSRAILPGGNSGDYTSDHYRDQLDDWLASELKPMPLEASGDVAVEFTEDDG
jgi:penicillin amidase